MSDGSGDLLADRRYAYAQGALRDGDLEAAADLARQALELAPGFAAAWFLLGEARERQFRSAGSGPEASGIYRDAVGAFEAALSADGIDRMGARARLAALGIGDPLLAMSPGYLRSLFDEYAVRFDRHLTGSLKYRGPQLLHAAIRRASAARPGGFDFARALDLGCGTGLVGEVFRDRCRTLAGIDLSPVMTERARRRKLYDELAVGDLVEWLQARPDGSADLVVAADVFVYLGDLAPAFGEVARVLARHGLFAFTLQAHPGDGILFGDDLRYAHGTAYVESVAAGCGLAVLSMEAVSTREDRGEPVPGWLAVLGR